MSTNGNIKTNNGSMSHGNGNHSVGKNIAIESIGFTIAEGVSMATSLGVVFFANKMIPEPIMKYGSQALGKVVFEPMIDTIDRVLPKFCKLEECKVDKDKSREERAAQIGKYAIIFGAAWSISMGVKLYTRSLWTGLHGFNESHPAALPAGAPLWKQVAHKISPTSWSRHETMLLMADEGVHYGSLLLLNNQFAPFTDRMIRKTSKVIQDVTGTDEKNAHETATMWSVWELPNVLGGLAAIGVIAGSHKYGWGKTRPDLTQVEKLAAKAASTIGHAL